MPELTPKQLEVLMKPLHPARVMRRQQGGASLSYLAAWDIKAMLIRVFGIGGFSVEVLDATIIDVDKISDTEVKVAAMCTVRLSIPQLQCVYTETAVAGQKGRTVGDVADFAIKTAESDALKRAAIYLGTQFGLSLYDNGSTAEVVRIILAPGQEWDNTTVTDDQRAELAASIGLQGDTDA